MAQKISDNIAKIVKPLKNAQIWINEAENALGYITPYLNLPKGARILEIGSGACVLLGHLAQEHKSLEFTGVEPVGPGFDSLREFISSIKQLTDIELIEKPYQDVHIDQPFDLVFLVNVFEHLPDWQHFLRFARDAIGENGKCVILCPNYGIPVESHYGIPVIFNKKITHWFFKNYITEFDQKYDCHGLWDSLNFVRFSRVKKAAQSLELNINFNPEISFDFIRRLDEDSEFSKRQGRLGDLALFFERTGFLNLFKHRFFWNYHPYMYLEITRA